MGSGSDTQKSIVEQIYDELLLLLGDKGFDSNTLDELHQLSRDGNLTKLREVSKAIEARPGSNE